MSRRRVKLQNMLTKLLGVARFSISAVSSISTMKVLRSLKRSSFAPTLEKSLSTIPMTAESAGTKDPVCARIAVNAVCRSKVDFPAIFGPVMTCTKDSGVKCTEFGVKILCISKSPCSTVGCLPLTTLYMGLGAYKVQTSASSVRKPTSPPELDKHSSFRQLGMQTG